jgi:NHLM bacteriocin system ABC transporter ATP-binding protein
VEDFKAKITDQKERDSELLEQSYGKLLHSLSNTKKKFISHRSSRHSTRNVINNITEYFGYDHISIPVEIDDINDQLEYMKTATGIMSRKITLRDNWWVESADLVLCKLAGDDIYVILYPKGLGGYGFVDPQTKEYETVNKDNSKLFDRTATAFYKPFPDEKITFGKLTRYMLKSVSKAEMTYVICISAAIGLAGMILPMINEIIYDRVIPSGTIDDLMPIAVLLIGSFLSIITAGLLKDLLFARINSKVVCRVQSAAWARVLKLPASFFKKYSTGEVLQKVKSLEQVAELLSGSTVAVSLSALFSFVYLYQIAVIAPQLMFPTIVIILVLLTFSFTTSILEAKQQRKLSDKSAELSGVVYQLLQGISKIKVAGARVRAFSIWADKYSQKANVLYRPNIILTISGAIYSFFSIATNILVYWVVAKSDITPAQYIAFNTAFGAFILSLSHFHSIVRQISLISSNYDIAKPILDELPEDTGGKARPGSLSGNIDVHSVSFRYTEDGPLILDDLSLSVKQGEYVALVGASGCGKSTLMRILLGFEKPRKGAVYYDNHELSGLDIHSIRQQIGVVMQNATLFADDIFSNISVCAPWITLEEAWEVAEKAGIADDIRAMPMGMFTILSEDGGGISGGQKQRLMIARALASDPKIIKFDEATSALDNITQSIVVDTLNKMSCTRIVIAHRLSTVINCDRIIVLDRGKIAEEGSYKELMEKQGLFAEMARRQIA